MSGIVSMDRNPTLLEEVAGDEAYTKWDNGDFMRDGDNWRFFTGNVLIRLFRSHHGDEWRMPREMDPIWDVEEVAEYLQQEFDRIERYH